MASDYESYRIEMLRRFEQQHNDAEQAIANHRQVQARAREAIARLGSPPPEPNLCPDCWYEHSKRSPLKPADSKDGMIDVFRCSACGFSEERRA